MVHHDIFGVQFRLKLNLYILLSLCFIKLLYPQYHLWNPFYGTVATLLFAGAGDEMCNVTDSALIIILLPKLQSVLAISAV